MMTPRTYWQRFIDEHGGVKGAAVHLGLPYSTVAGVTNGHRGIGRDLAKRMAEADPALDETVLVWVRPRKDQRGAMHG